MQKEQEGLEHPAPPTPGANAAQSWARSLSAACSRCPAQPPCTKGTFRGKMRRVSVEDAGQHRLCGGERGIGQLRAPCASCAACRSAESSAEAGAGVSGSGSRAQE